MNDDYPRVYVKEEPNDTGDYTQKVNEIFNRLTLNNIPKGLVDIKKKQLLNHSMCKNILSCLEGVLKLLGQTDDRLHRAEFNQYTDELIYYHCPFYLTMNNHFEEMSNESCVNYEYWDLFVLYSKYYELVCNKCWNDYYSLIDVGLNGLKLYQVMDMCNDLYMCGVIKGFNSTWFDNFKEDWDNEVPDDFKVEIFL